MKWKSMLLFLLLICLAGGCGGDQSGAVYWLDPYWMEIGADPAAESRLIRCDGDGNLHTVFSDRNLASFTVGENDQLYWTTWDGTESRLFTAEAGGQEREIYTAASRIQEPLPYGDYVYFLLMTIPTITRGIVCRVNVETGAFENLRIYGVIHNTSTVMDIYDGHLYVRNSFSNSDEPHAFIKLDLETLTYEVYRFSVVTTVPGVSTDPFIFDQGRLYILREDINRKLSLYVMEVQEDTLIRRQVEMPDDFRLLGIENDIVYYYLEPERTVYAWDYLENDLAAFEAPEGDFGMYAWVYPADSFFAVVLPYEHICYLCSESGQRVRMLTYN